MAQKFGLFDKDGKPKGFWADDIYSADEIPKLAIPITDEQWQTLLSNGNAYWQDGEVIAPPIGPVGVLDA